MMLAAAAHGDDAHVSPSFIRSHSKPVLLNSGTLQAPDSCLTADAS